MNDLTFNDLAKANAARAKLWRQGSTAEIPLMFALLELAGEVGEACNAAKKLERSKLGLVGGATNTDALIDEIADVVICCQLVADHIGFDLGAAVARKFNATSDKHGFSVKLPDPDGVYLPTPASAPDPDPTPEPAPEPEPEQPDTSDDWRRHRRATFAGKAPAMPAPLWNEMAKKVDLDNSFSFRPWEERAREYLKANAAWCFMHADAMLEAGGAQ